MSFLTWQFALFFFWVALLYFFVPQRVKLPILFVASYLWYFSGSGLYTVVLLLSTLFEFQLAKTIASSQNSAARRAMLISSLCVNLGLLVVFKYAPLNLDHPLAGLPLIAGFNASPILIGVSYFTFVKIAYIIDVYQRKIVPENNFAIFGTFVAFFPTVSAGPIERAKHLIPQLRRPFVFDEDRTVDGLRLILWGAFKKAVIADQIAVYVNSVYGQAQAYSGLPLVAATLFFSIQIYADFSGYTDMARGIAKVLGIDLFENFRYPYFSESVAEFWRRWHISLTNWIRDYLFFPLTRFLLIKTNRRYQRVVEISCYLIVMTLVGLWHGATLTLLIWGLLHGIYMSVEALLNTKKQSVNRVKNKGISLLKVLTVFILVSFAWIFFRANSLNDAFYIAGHIPDPSQGITSIIKPVGSGLQFGLDIILIAFLVAADWVQHQGYKLPQWKHKLAVIPRWGLYYLALILIYQAIEQSSVSAQQFIYFQF
jgi:alginate O-acetyltransferase complex protein AlgI